MSIRVTDFPTAPLLHGAIPCSANSIKEEIATLELYIQQLKTYQHEIKDKPVSEVIKIKEIDTSCNKENFDNFNSCFSLIQNEVVNKRIFSPAPAPPVDDVILVDDLTESPEKVIDSESVEKTFLIPQIHSKRISGKLRKLKTLVIPSKKIIMSKHNIRKLELSVNQAQVARDHNYSSPNKANVSIRHLGQFSWGKLNSDDKQYLCKVVNAFVNHCYSRQARRQILRKLGLSHTTVNGIFNLATDKFNSNRLNQIERTLDLGKTTCCHKAHLSSYFLAPVSRLKLPEYSKQCSRILRDCILPLPVSNTNPSPRIKSTNSNSSKAKKKTPINYQNESFTTRSLRRRKY
ncbi:hypothetical protein LOD99_2296 [Oopsacas minuta]|uniref:BEN domain-containing protein n=1 Tax=Oopsacas minuta TaxID=111878 RepID=A0AAV7K1B6_9METZ|nr:hypothetical protein LOD99_2296 [Oopsacas minuta]